MATMTGLWVDNANAPRVAVVSMSMPDLQHSYYGAPSAVWLTVTTNDDASVSIDLQLFNVTATRLGGAHFYHFGPALQGGDYKFLVSPPPAISRTTSSW